VDPKKNKDGLCRRNNTTIGTLQGVVALLELIFKQRNKRKRGSHYPPSTFNNRKNEGRNEIRERESKCHNWWVGVRKIPMSRGEETTGGKKKNTNLRVVGWRSRGGKEQLDGKGWLQKIGESRLTKGQILRGEVAKDSKPIRYFEVTGSHHRKNPGTARTRRINISK